MNRYVRGMLTVIAYMMAAAMVYGGTTDITQPRPADEEWMPPNVRRQVNRIFSIWPEERAEAAASLRDMGARAFRAIPVLIRILDDDGPIWTPAGSTSPWTYPAFEAAAALAAIGTPAMEPLVACLQHDHPFVRAHAAFAIGRIRNPAAVESLLPLLSDEDWFTRVCAADALGEIGDPSAVDELIAALQDPVWNVRESAARALGRIKDSRATDELIHLLADPFPNVRVSALHALVLITGVNHGMDQAAWLRTRENAGQ